MTCLLITRFDFVLSTKWLALSMYVQAEKGKYETSDSEKE
jgi:hypothetical protein